MTPSDRLAVILEAQAWETVLRVIAKSPVPYEIVAPLISEIQTQCMKQQQPLALVPTENAAAE